MKKTVFFLMCFALLISFWGIPAYSSKDSRTVLYLDYGNVKIGENEISGYDENGNLITDVDDSGYIVTQHNSSEPLDREIVVSSGVQNIELNNVNISRTNETDYAFAAQKYTNVTVTLYGENYLVSGIYRAGLDIAVNAAIIIEGEGMLYAQSNLEAGIGGGNGKSNGSLIINSGTIYAVGGIDGYSAGIGGGSSGTGGNIEINGGNIVAIGGDYAAGIGGGNLRPSGNIIINGGTITAIGGKNGAGIGGGFTGTGDNIVINGGSVKAIAGEDADDIGNGYHCESDFNGVHNSEGKQVSLMNVEIDDFKAVYINGISRPPITSKHDDDDNLYLYTDGEEKLITVYYSDNRVGFYILENSLTEFFPYGESAERFSDRLIVMNEISTSDGCYLVNDTELFCGETCIDSFSLSFRGDVDSDGNLNAMDSVIASCICSGMLIDELTAKIADTDNNKVVDVNDVIALEKYGLTAKGE